MSDRFLIDTSFVQAMLNASDENHAKAMAFIPQLRTAREIWITEAILIEIGNAFASYKRDTAIRFIDRAFATPNIRVVTIDRGLLKRSLDLYRKRNDKTWGLTDCISFVVMQENKLTDAATADRHFVQAGFNALLL